MSRVTCTGVGTHSGVLTPSSVAPALGQGWVRTEPGHPPSPARAACSLEQLLVSPGWAGLGWAGLGWAGQLGPVTAAAVMIYCHASPLAFLLFSPPTTSEHPQQCACAPFKLPSIRQRGPSLHPTFHALETLQTSPIRYVTIQELFSIMLEILLWH